MPRANANHLWRKNPRKFAPKSRHGCKTCKIRRIKCDQGRPSCQKCVSTGRVCDGYDEPNQQDASNPKFSAVEGVSIIVRQSSSNTHSSILPRANLRPLLFSETAQSKSISFFENVSIQHLNKYHPVGEPWRRTLMMFSQTVPAVQEAATALSLLHQTRVLRSRDKSDRQTPLIHYNRAIQLLLKQHGGKEDSTEQRAITMLICYLFICFDHLAGNDVQAIKHLKGGLKLTRDSTVTMFGDVSQSGNYKDSTSTDIDLLICLVTRQLRRFDAQALMFIMDWTIDDMDLLTRSQLPSDNFCFASIDEAFYHMDIMIAKVMSFRNAKPGMYPVGDISPTVSPSPSKHVLLNQMATWSRLFENMLPLSGMTAGSDETALDLDMLINLLRLRHAVGWIFLSSYGTSKEMEFDAFLSQFQRCIVLADHVASMHESRSGSMKSTFTPEIGILPLLYIIGAKCRDPTTRREAVKILRRRNIQEAVWNSKHTAKALERMIEIEEGQEFESTAVRSMEEIAICQRIEAVSWTYVREPLPRLDLVYTFCNREGVHSEPLSIE